MTLSTIHRDYLTAHAVTPGVIDSCEIRSEGNEIVFPWQDGELITEQRRPWPGESGVYFWETGKELHFWTLRDAGPGSPILLVEGTKQSLAAASWAPPEYTVMGMAGCWGWIHAKLSRFKGRELFLCLDADAATNLDVYDAGDKLGEKVKRYGVSLRYLRIPGTGSQGLDDYLASLDEGERTDILAYEIANAASKPAERRPTSRKRKMESDLPDLGGRVGVAVNLDRKEVIDKITSALKERHDGIDLFNYGEVLTRVKGHETQPLDRDRFYSMLADAVACFRYTEATDKRPAVFEPTWPDPPSIGAIMSKAEEFSSLKRVVRVPFLRHDGSICTTPGYDPSTHTILVESGFGDLHVPAEPTQKQTRLAAKYLMTEWLGDLPFKTEADRANALALVLTPFMRGLVPLVPLAVVSGLQMGVGKNLLADCVHILATGEAAMPLPYVNNDEETRKQLTAAFASGAEMFVFDEAHVVEGAQIARAVTSLTYADRLLGASRMAKFPNNVTWMSLGNQVQVNGDMARRVYFVYLHPSGMNVIDREAKEFRHPDLKAWTAENRTDLVNAALTVLRGWVTAGRPAFSRGACMGSFEPWDRMMSGVLAYAGHAAFLTDMRERRSESDYTQSYWEAHVHWLHGLFGGKEFTTRQVQEAALRDPQGYEAPPGMEDASGKAFTRQLGQGYGKHRDRNYNGVRLVKSGMGHKSTIKWRTISENGGLEGCGGNATTPPVAGDPVLGSVGDVTLSRNRGGREIASASLLTSEQEEAFQELIDLRQDMESDDIFDMDCVCGYPKGDCRCEPDHDASYLADPDQEPITLGFDLETADADKLFLGGHEGPFVRLSGWDATDQASPCLYGSGRTDDLIDDLEQADVIYGHNILGFDLLALAHHHGADYDALAAKAVDTRVLAYLLEPPAAKAANVGYDLDSVAQRLGHTGKTDDLKVLAKKYGGFDRIPVDTPEYNDYLRGDLAATKHVYDKFTWELDLSENRDVKRYAEREMKVVTLQNRMTLNGWAADTELLAERAAEEDAKRLEAIQELHERYGVPLAAPDRFKLLPKAQWPAAYRERISFDSWTWTTEEDEFGYPVGAPQLTLGRKLKYRIDVMRRYMNIWPEAAVARGLAVRIPGKVHTKPWVTDEGKAALVRAFNDAGAKHVPLSPKSGTLLTSADALGEGAWYCPERRRAVKGMLHPDAYGDNDAVRAIVDVMLRATGVRDKYNQVAKLVSPPGRVHGFIGAPQGSGRWAMSPVTTMGKRTPQALRERDVLVADPGHVLIACDHSQLDIRTVAALSQDPELIAMLQPDSDDFHELMAEVYFGDRKRRPDAKPINHGVNYNMGWKAIAERNGLDPEMVQAALRARGERFHVQMAWAEGVVEQAAAGMLLDNGFGRLMQPTPERAFTQAPALMGQGASRDVMTESLLRLDRISEGRVRPYLRAVVHDEIVVSVPEAEVEEWAEMLREAMTWEWKGVPILCDVSQPAYRWSECK